MKSLTGLVGVVALVWVAPAAGNADGRYMFVDPCSTEPGSACVPNTGDVVDAAPCDNSNHDVRGRGWYCKSNSAEVLLQSAYQTSGLGESVIRGFAEPYVPAGAPRGALMIHADLAWTCAPCGNGGWCYNGHPCQVGCIACPEENELRGRGLMCKNGDRVSFLGTSYPMVCVDEQGMAVHDGTKHVAVQNNEVTLQLETWQLASLMPRWLIAPDGDVLWQFIAGSFLYVVMALGVEEDAAGEITGVGCICLQICIVCAFAEPTSDVTLVSPGTITVPDLSAPIALGALPAAQEGRRLRQLGTARPFVLDSSTTVNVGENRRIIFNHAIKR